MAKTQLIEPNRIDISDINDIPINNSAPTNTIQRIESNIKIYQLIESIKFHSNDNTTVQFTKNIVCHT